MVAINGVEFDETPLHQKFGGLRLTHHLDVPLDVEPWLKSDHLAVMRFVRRASAVAIDNSAHLTALTEHWAHGTDLDTNQIVQWHSDEEEGEMVALVGVGDGTATLTAKRSDIVAAMQANAEYLNPAKLLFTPSGSAQDYITMMRAFYYELKSNDPRFHRAIVNRFNNFYTNLARATKSYPHNGYDALLAYVSVFSTMVNCTAVAEENVYSNVWHPTEPSTFLMWTGMNGAIGESEIVHRRARRANTSVTRHDYRRAVLSSRGGSVFHDPHREALFLL